MTGNLLLSYYGDDFTGSTDVMEALSGSGVETVLFTSLPDDSQRDMFSHCDAVGLAGTSRSQSPDWMSENLPEVFRWLRSLDARFCHYKTCSTFDSAPDKGSIGRATEIALATFGQDRTALVIGAPQLRRYTYFGTLFAGYRDSVYRIDRHPVMSKHPATPMDEADLLMHLARQTSLSFACATPEDLAILQRGGALNPEKLKQSLMIDVFDTASQQLAGKVLEDHRDDFGPFLVGSSGIEYSLTAEWRERGLLKPRPDFAALDAKPRIAVVSGSCSPTTGRQIETALQNGFDGIDVDFAALAGGLGLEDEVRRVGALASETLKAGRSPLLYTAKGAADPGVDSGGSDMDRVGKTLGRLLAGLRNSHALERVAVAGGDTSSHALEELDIFALTLRHPIPSTPGSPVCNAHVPSGVHFEIALKGGQVGNDNYFVDLRDGTFVE